MIYAGRPFAGAEFAGGELPPNILGTGNSTFQHFTCAASGSVSVPAPAPVRGGSGGGVWLPVSAVWAQQIKAAGASKFQPVIFYGEGTVKSPVTPKPRAVRRVTTAAQIKPPESTLREEHLLAMLID